MKTYRLLLLSCLVVVGCNRNPKDDGTNPAPLFPQPQAVGAKPDGGYVINPLTGDSIKPIILENGDTLQTGVPIPAKGKLIHPDSVANPKVVKAPSPESLKKHNAHPNRHKIPENIPTFPVDHSQLKTIKLGEGNQDFVLINSTGDTVQTGVPTKAIGKTVSAIHPLPTPALSPAVKDAAITNLQYLDVDQGMNSSYVWSIVEDRSGNLWFCTNGGGVSMYNGESFIHFTEKEGLSSNYVRSLVEDKNGNLWFGTNGGGVSMYNGESFMHFTEKEGLSNNYVLSIIEDKNGNLWFGTSGGGVSMYNGESFTHFTEKEGLSNNYVWSIVEDKSGDLWFGTNGGGVSKLALSGVEGYNGEILSAGQASFTHYTEKEGLSNNVVRSIVEDKSGNLWFGTWGGGVSKLVLIGVEGYIQESFMHFTEKEGLSNNYVWSIEEDKSGNLWFGTNGGGVSKLVLSGVEGYNGETLSARQASFTHYTEKEGLSNNRVLSIVEDKSGNLWFCTNGGGVSIYNGESFMHFTEKEGLSNNYVRCIVEDKGGNLWFGTNGGGVSMYNGESFMHYTEKEGLSNNYVLSIVEDKSGNLWFGTNGGGVSKLVLNGAEGYNPEASNGTSGESLPAGQASFTHYTEKEGLSNNYVWSIVEDKSGNLWFGTSGGGVSMYNGETFTHYTEKEGLSNNLVLSIVEDKSGNLWFGTYGGGVSKLVLSGVEGYNPEASIGTGGETLPAGQATFTHYTEKEGLSNNVVLSIVEDKSGNLWFGTSGGGVSMLVLSDVQGYNGETLPAGQANFIHFTEKEGLSNNYVWSIVEDKGGNLHFATDKGLNVINPLPSTLKGGGVKMPQITIHTFQKGEGLKGLDFFLNSAYIDSKGLAWWGGGKGLEMLDLTKFSLATNPPVVHLRQLDINEQFIDYRNISDSLGNEIAFNSVQKFENYPLNLKLPYDKNHLTFYFAAIDWKAPHKIRYSYRMLGIDDNWSIPSKDAKAEYRNLSYSTYTFQIRAIGESGAWSEPFDYTFTINPPWWHTWWAYLSYTLLFLLALRIFSKYRERHLRAEKDKLEKTVEERTADVVAEKKEADKQRQRSDDLLLNILPEEVAEELKTKGISEAKQFSEVTVLFTDFKEFTNLSEKLTPKELVSDLNHCFTAFDEITHKHRIEKIKTIGDAYMAAGGLPTPNTTHAKDVVLAALEIRDFIEEGKAHKIANNQPFFEIRIGIHTGPLVAGIVGVKKFQYDIWGDTVNTASRMESSGEVGKVNISQFTYELLKDDPDFEFEHRGKISAKGKGEIEMWFVQLKK